MTIISIQRVYVLTFQPPLSQKIKGEERNEQISVELITLSGLSSPFYRTVSMESSVLFVHNPVSDQYVMLQ